MNDQPAHSKSQNEAILEWLRQGNTLTGLQALRLFGTLCLPRRVLDLKGKGHAIVSTSIKVNGKRIAEYYLPNSEPQQQRIAGL